MPKTLEEMRKRFAEGRKPTAPPPAPEAPKAAAPKPAPEAVRPAPPSTPTAKTPVRPPAPKPAPKPTTERLAPEAAYFKAKVSPDRDAAARALGYRDFATLEAVRGGSLGTAPRENTAAAAVAATEGRRAIEQAQREGVEKTLEERVSDVPMTVPYLKRVVGEPAQAVGEKLLPAVGYIAGNAMDDPGTPDVDEGAAYREFYNKQFQERAAERLKQQAQEEEKKAARFEMLYGDDPDMQAAKKVADKLRLEERPRNPTTSGRLIQELTEAELEKLYAERGGPNAVTSGPENAKLYEEAHNRAVAKAVDLSYTGAWHLTVQPKDVAVGDNAPADWRALLPRQKVSPDGSTVRSESLPGWFFSVPMSALDAGVLAAVQGIDGDIKDRDLSTRVWENLAGRQDVLSYRIEQDPELQADLSSNDTARVNKALLTLAPFMAVTMLTPDPVSLATGGLAVVSDVGKLAKHAPTVMKDLKAAGTAAEKAKVLNNAVARAKELDKAAKEVESAKKFTDRIVPFAEQVRKGTTFDDVVEEARGRDASMATWLKDAHMRVLQTHPEVAEYLKHLGAAATDVTKENAPEVPFGPDDIARREALWEEADDITRRIREARKEFEQGLKEENQGAVHGELRPELETAQRRLKEIAADVEQITNRERAAAGRQKFLDEYDNATNEVVSILERVGRGEEVPALTASQVTGVSAETRAKPPDIDQDTWDVLLGPDATVAAAERLARAQTPEELVKTLSRLPPSTRDRIAQRLMFPDYDALKEGMKITPESVAAGVDKAKEKLSQAESALEAVRQAHAEKVAKAEAAVEAAKKGTGLSEDEKEIIKLERQLGYQRNDLDPMQMKNVVDQGGIPTTAREVYKREAELDDIANKLSDLRTTSPEAKALDAAESALYAFRHPAEGTKPLSKAKTALKVRELEAAVEKAKAALDEAARPLTERQLQVLKELGPTPETLKAKGLSGTEKYTPKEKRQIGWYEKWMRVQAESQKRKLDTENKIAAIRARMKAQGPTSRPKVDPEKVAKAEAKLAEVRAAAAAAAKPGEQTVAELRAVLVEKMGARADVRAGIEEALGGLREELSGVARQARERETFFAQQRRLAEVGVGPDPLVFERRDLQSLRGEIVDILDRDIRRMNTRGSVRATAVGIYEAFKQFWAHNADVQEASITPALRYFTRRLQGEIEEVGEKLARAAASVGDTDDVNLRALDAVAEEVPYFKEAVSDKQIAAEYAAYVIGAYIQADVTLKSERAKRLAQVLVDWAASPDTTLVDLRRDLLAATRAEMGEAATAAQLQKPQLGDVFLAYGVGSAGATQRVMRDAGFLAMSPSDARTINAVLSDLHRLGGNADASVGRQRMLHVLVDPDLYRPDIPNPWNTALRQTTAEPMELVYNRASLPRPAEKLAAKARHSLGAIMDETTAMYRTELYVPRAVRDAIQQQIEAVIATRRIPQQFDPGAALQFWRQAVIVGVGLSSPAQGFMDHIGDTLQIATKYPVVAAKTFARSTASQMLHFQGAAQVGMLLEYLMGKAGKEVDPGTAAKAFDRWVSEASFSPDVQRVLDASDEVVGKTGMTGRQVWRSLREAGLPETLLTGQVTRSVALYAGKEAPRGFSALSGAVAGAGAGLVLGNIPGAFVGALAGSIFGATGAGRKLAAANHAALVGLANVAATRRRVALAVSLMEKGMAPAEAGREAVRLVGAFSREIGPTERAYITWWFPFFAYRKFNVRRTFQALVNPNWAKFLEEGSTSLELAVNAYLDDTDEYGFHTGPMDSEPDPVDYGNLLRELRDDNPGKSDEWCYQEADRLSMGYPRAIERYARMVAKLREFDYPDGRLYALDPTYIEHDYRQKHPGASDEEVNAAIGQLLEDIDALRTHYWAPDPVKSMLPEYAQDKFTLFLGKARSQAMTNMFRSGQGTAERKSDELRYAQPFSDPNVDGVGTQLALLAAMSNLTPLSSGTAGQDLFGVVFRQSWVQTLMEVAGLVDPDGEQDTPISQQAGENLLSVGLGKFMEIRTPQGMPLDPANLADQSDIREVRYYIPARWNSTMYLIPQVFAPALAAMRVMDVHETLTGGKHTTGEADLADQYGSYAFFATGTRLRQTSPDAQGYFARRDVEARTQAALDDVRSVKPTNVNPDVRVLREWTSLAAEPDFEAQVQRAVETLRAGKAVKPDDVKRLRAKLLQTRAPAEVMKMTDQEVATTMASSP